MDIVLFCQNLFESMVPRRCLVCERRMRRVCLCTGCDPGQCVIESTHRCSRCFSALQESGECLLCGILPPPQNSLRYLWDYDGSPRAFITAMKYLPSMKLAKLAGSRMADALPRMYPETSWDCIIPVPSSPQGLRSRGFNQCNVLARAVARKCESPLLPFSVRCHRVRNPQASLPPARRLRNVRDAFVVYDAAIAGKRILLIDDVITTGATSATLTKCFYAAGARSVDLYVLARSCTWHEYRYRIYSTFGSSLTPH